MDDKKRKRIHNRHRTKVGLRGMNATVAMDGGSLEWRGQVESWQVDEGKVEVRQQSFPEMLRRNNKGKGRTSVLLPLL
jgi:urease accessory protein UreE